MKTTIVVSVAGLCLLGSSAYAAPPSAVWAVNVNGPAYEAMDGTRFAAETDVSGGTPGALEVVKGSQDPALYAGYRVGDVRIAHALASGTYDVTFYFAEPLAVPVGRRTFDAYLEQKRVIEDINVMGWRDGKAQSALTVTVPGVAVSDGRLDVHFVARQGQPVLSALSVRQAEPAIGWTLAWRDEFDGERLDDARWTPDLWPARKVNDEDQVYTDRPRNLRLANGHLIIEAHRETYENGQYTSARIHSQGKGDLLYGRIEVRARLPQGQGTWPAIWMLPSDPFRYATKCSDGDWQGNDACDAWPNSGEIDIMEHVGYQMGHVHGTVHNEAYYWAKWEQRKGRIILDEVDRRFRAYALEWTPERIDAYVDDTHYFSYVNEHDGWRSWPYDHPYHVILNLAVGGAWGRAGGPIDDAVFPQQLVVDYVRVYEPKGATPTAGR
ncbi:MAG: family 16 glycosylhydrolase [Pseudomonadota bacterium]